MSSCDLLMPKVSFHRRMTRVRILTLLLLGSLAWGATAEVTHRHDNQLSPRSVQSQRAILSNSATTPQTEANKPDTQGLRSPSSAQCLICQLHRNLSATLFGPTLQFAAADALLVPTGSSIISTLSSSASMHHGRAPPAYLQATDRRSGAHS